jgi:HlyD family secretion protein
MTASANIITKTNATALSVPLQSVAARSVDQLAMKGEKRKEAEKRYKADHDGFVEVVFCVEKGKAVAKQVKTGIQGDDLIEILDGLKEGDEIVTGSYRAISKDLDNGALVTINNKKTPERGRKGEGHDGREG